MENMLPLNDVKHVMATRIFEGVAGEMVQQLRALTDLLEDLSLMPSTHMVHKTVTPVPENLCPFLFSAFTKHTRVKQTYHQKNTNAHKVAIYKDRHNTRKH